MIRNARGSEELGLHVESVARHHDVGTIADTHVLACITHFVWPVKNIHLGRKRCVLFAVYLQRRSSMGPRLSPQRAISGILVMVRQARCTWVSVADIWKPRWIIIETPVLCRRVPWGRERGDARDREMVMVRTRQKKQNHKRFAVSCRSALLLLRLFQAILSPYAVCNTDTSRSMGLSTVFV